MIKKITHNVSMGDMQVEIMKETAQYKCQPKDEVTDSADCNNASTSFSVFNRFESYADNFDIDKI
ncbi:MAG TPA: hypothetical protein VGG71_04140, partial [Chitinophagaceae bacterium]